MSGESLVSLWKCFLLGITNDSEDEGMGIFPDVQGLEEFGSWELTKRGLLFCGGRHDA